MQKTGIVRKVDDLGRIVIPKEIRKTLKIREGDELEISVEDNTKILLRKYEPLGEVLKVCSSYIETLSKVSNSTCILFDTNKVLFCYGNNSSEYKNKKISEKFLYKLLERSIMSIETKVLQIVEDEDIKKITNERIAPLNIDGSVIGAIVMLNTSKTRMYGAIEDKLIEQTVEFFKSQMEI